MPDSASSDEDVPLAVRKEQLQKSKPARPETAKVNGGRPRPSYTKEDDDDDDDDGEEEDDDDDVPLSRRMQRKAAAQPKRRSKENGSNNRPAKRARRGAGDDGPESSSGGGGGGGNGRGGEIKWTTLRHGGILFPPEYQPHGIKMKYDNVPVDLTPEQEEIATMYAAMLQTDYIKKDTFNKNFWEEFKALLGAKHVIKSLEKCDFQDIYDHLMADREAKKKLSKEEKEKLKKDKEEAEAKFKYALVDGEPELVGNFRVEPPGLFRGRGEHPKMGKLKRRIYPRDCVINIGKGEPLPTHPYPDQEWKEVRHDQTVTWLAFWRDPIDTKGYKYVWLAANSKFKTDSDLAKYEKARSLKNHIERIRQDYQRLWKSGDLQQQQMSTALYFIDKLALRAGHEKDEDEADTVGCCTLKVGNVELLSGNRIKFDFLGKDSVRYENTVTVDPKVHANVGSFMKKDGAGRAKSPDDQLFDTMDAQNLNVMMKDYMEGLSVKVFRTYNASITLDRLLWEAPVGVTPEEKKAEYDRANKEVAVLCNHQRAVSRGHETSMAKMDEKIEEARKKLEDLEAELAKAKKGDGNPERLTKQLDAAKGRLEKLIVMKNSREELKTVALGTSKINYLDPRITVAWCKRREMPLEKIFNKSLLGKFAWAMTVEPEFRF